jgi:hypothetical protein
MSRPDGTHHHGPLAGLGAGAAAVLFATVVLLLAWHRVAGQVSAGITVLVYAVIAAAVGLLLAVLAYVFLWLRHRARNPGLLSRRQPPPDAEAVPQAIAAAESRAIEPPRVYLNLTDDQFAALVRRDTEGE